MALTAASGEGRRKIVALNHHAIGGRLTLDLFKGGHRATGHLREPQGEGGGVVLGRDAVLVHVAVESRTADFGLLLVHCRINAVNDLGAGPSAGTGHGAPVYLEM
jgi:hypothetical protein